jgi:molybdate transport system substrate-binding protein
MISYSSSHKKVLVIVLTGFFLMSCGNNSDQQVKELLIYCGITMVKPISEIARIIEKKENIKIHISQGGSQDLYDSLKISQKGDIYFPGSASYREKNLTDGLLKDAQLVGYNQAALMVQKNNPKQITGDVHQLLRQDLLVAICNPESGSVGRETKKILDRLGIYKQVVENTAILNADSRTLNNSLKNKKADVTINWRATAFFKSNIDFIDVINLSPEVAIPKKLQLNLLSFSEHPEIAKRFMNYTASAEGQSIFRKYGFLDKDMKSN